MQSLELLSTQYTPYVRFDITSRELLIKGVSRPENTEEFYRPVLAWLDSFINNELEQRSERPPVRFIIELDYFNSISAKYIVSIILKCKALQDVCGLIVEWRHYESDEEGLEWGQDLSQIVGIPFEYVPLPD